MPEKNTSAKEGLILVQFEDTVHHGEKAWWQELEEAAVHNFSVVKKLRKMNSGIQFPFPFHSF